MAKRHTVWQTQIKSGSKPWVAEFHSTSKQEALNAAALYSRRPGLKARVVVGRDEAAREWRRYWLGEERSNPAKTRRLSNFSGTITRNADGTVTVKGRKK